LVTKDKIETIILNKEDAVSGIFKKLGILIGDENISPCIEAEIDHFIDRFFSNTHFLLEYPYVDRVYRDSYYNYFSSKHKSYLKRYIESCCI
jgi:hypothetical protein